MKSFAVCMLIGATSAIRTNRFKNVNVGDTVLWQNEYIQTGAGDYSHDWESNSTIEPYDQRDHAWNNVEFDMSNEVEWHNETIHAHAGAAHVFNVTINGYTHNNQGWPYKTEVALSDATPTFLPGELRGF